MTEHQHQWFKSPEEGCFRCGVFRCKAKLPGEFLTTLDRDQIRGLDDAYALYVASVPPNDESVTTSVTKEQYEQPVEGGTQGEVPVGDGEERPKQCSVCGRFKPRSAYHKRVRSADGLQSRCKPCNVEAVRRSRAKAREEQRVEETSDRVRRADGDGLYDGEELRASVDADADGVQVEHEDSWLAQLVKKWG